MRVWDIHPKHLCRNHLLGEHRELHALWSIITNDKKGYRNHPETMRWRGKLRALYARHASLVREMGKRGYCHKSPLDRRRARGSPVQDQFVDPVRQQIARLRRKRCGCLSKSQPDRKVE